MTLAIVRPTQVEIADTTGASLIEEDSTQHPKGKPPLRLFVVSHIERCINEVLEASGMCTPKTRPCAGNTKSVNLSRKTVNIPFITTIFIESKMKTTTPEGLELYLVR